MAGPRSGRSWAPRAARSASLRRASGRRSSRTPAMPRRSRSRRRCTVTEIVVTDDAAGAASERLAAAVRSGSHFVLLGLGPDGHCASLFPSQPALDERDRLAVAVEEPGMEPWVPRVTLTLT